MPRPKSTATKVKEPKKGRKPKSAFDKDKTTQEKAEKAAHTPEAELKRATTEKTKEAIRLVQPLILSTIKDALVKPNEDTGRAWYEQFISTFLADAIEHPEGRPAQLMASNLFSTDILSKLDHETEKMIARDIAFSRYRLSSTLFRQQKEVFEDQLSDLICVLCGRRSGKTELNARNLVSTALEPNTPACYIHLTFQNAVAQLYDLVVQCSKIAGLEIVNGEDKGNGKEGSRSDGEIIFSNGSSIKFRGNANRQEIEKIRGYKYKKVIIDEAQSQKNLRYLIEDVLQPLLLDYENSQLILSGTPPRIPGTYFESAYIGNEYQSYHWDLRDNPFIPNHSEVLEEICKKKGLTMDSALIQREYLGQIVYDTEALCYKGYKVYNGQLPADFIPNRVYIGADFGFADYNAIITLAADTIHKRAYVYRESKFNHAGVGDIVADIRKAYDGAKQLILERNHNVPLDEAIMVICDQNEKSIAYELVETYQINAYCAYKYDKNMAIEQLAGLIRTGEINIIEGGVLEDEAKHTVHPRDPDTDAILPGYDDEVYHPDAFDSLLYVSRQYLYETGGDLGGQGQKVE